MDKFAALSAFLAVIEHGGFAPAARRLDVAPSSLTRQLNALEEHLGMLLLNRSTRTVTLTEAGEQYYEDARRILDELEDADRAVSESAGPPTGTLRISMPVAFGRLHLAPVIPKFLYQFPGMRLDVHLSDAVTNLVEERIDVAIRLGPPASQNLVARKLAPHRRVICTSQDYLGEHGTPTRPSDLEQHNCLLFDYATTVNTWTLSRGSESEKVAVAGNLRANGSELLREAAIGGAGVALLPTWLVGQDIAAGRLVPLLEAWTPSIGVDGGAIWAVYLQNRRGSKKLAALLDFLESHIGSPPYWERYDAVGS